MNSPSRCRMFSGVTRRWCGSADVEQALTTISLGHARRGHLLEQAVDDAGPIAHPVRLSPPVPVGGELDGVRLGQHRRRQAGRHEIDDVAARLRGQVEDVGVAIAFGTRRQELAGVGLAQQRADQVAAPVQIRRGHDQFPEAGLPQALAPAPRRSACRARRDSGRPPRCRPSAAARARGSCVPWMPDASSGAPSTLHHGAPRLVRGRARQRARIATVRSAPAAATITITPSRGTTAGTMPGAKARCSRL